MRIIAACLARSIELKADTHNLGVLIDWLYAKPEMSRQIEHAVVCLQHVIKDLANSAACRIVDNPPYKKPAKPVTGKIIAYDDREFRSGAIRIRQQADDHEHIGKPRWLSLSQDQRRLPDIIDLS